METGPTTSSEPDDPGRPDRIRAATAIAAALMLVLLGAVLVVQIEVTDAEVDATRSCGSVFDSVADRSGWQQWWAQDLDESDAIRPALVRTTRCPDAVNQQVAIAVVLGMAAVAAGAVSMVRRRTGRSTDTTASPMARIARTGRLTSVLGGALTTLGVIAVVVLVADADSTLFLYTDRLVVAVVGLIVLIPTITLFVLGRVLVLLAEDLQPSEGDRADG